MKDIKINDNRDLDLEKNQIKLVTDEDAIYQRLRIRLLTMLGEHFLFQQEGVPYMESILVKNPDLGEVANLFTATISETEGIRRVVSLDTDYDPVQRTLGISFEVVIESSPPTIIKNTFDISLTIGETLLIQPPM